MFSQLCVCPNFRGLSHPADGGGGVPHPKSRWGGGGPDGGVPHPRSGPGGSPSFLTGGIPHPNESMPSFLIRGTGVPPCRTRWVTPLPPPPHPGLDGYPLPCQKTEQHSKHLLRSGRYASCVHAGGLSCYF